MKTAFLFPGQGSQALGMGYELSKEHTIARETFEEADHILGFSLSKLCFQGPGEDLTKTQNCQPGILTMSIAAWQAFKSNPKSQAPNSKYTAGLSLGEYSALVAAGAVSFEDNLERMIQENKTPDSVAEIIYKAIET